MNRLAAVLTAVVITLLLAFRATDVLDLPARDAMLRLLPARPAAATAIVAIDEESLRELGPWPWDRQRLASLVDRIAGSGARAVVIDVVLTDPRPGDLELARALKRLPAFAVSVLNDRGEWLVPSPPLRAATLPVHGNFELDHDGILRRFASTKQTANTSLTALSLAAASMITGAPVPIGRSIEPAFRTRPNAIPTISAAALLQNQVAIPRGKVIFLGPTAPSLGDRVRTPVSNVLDAGVTVHAAATESVIRNEVIRESPPVVSGILAGLIAIFITTSRRGLGALAIIALGSFALLAMNIAVPAATLSIVVVGSMAVSATHKFDLFRKREAESKRVLAHELKTPLASMRNLSQLLSEFDLNEPERKRAAALIGSEAGKLQSMVNVLLDLERLPMRDFGQSSAVIDVGELVRTRVDFLGASTDRTLTVNAPNGIFARADAALIERVVDNLVGNALKYTPDMSPVNINVSRTKSDVVIAVEDRGPGISDAERARIFDRFFRGSTAAGTQGLGLGLSLVAEVARWHGGSVAVESPARGGARFSFAIPAIAAAAAGSM